MFAVIKTGGKQYKVAADDVITIEKVAGEAGEAVTFDEVLLIGGETTVVGAPTVGPRSGPSARPGRRSPGRGPAAAARFR